MRQSATARPRGGRSITAFSLAYAIVVLITLALMRWWGERWWPANMLLFGPRAVFLVPLVPLLIWAAWARRISVWAVQGATLIVVAGPLMGFAVPWARLEPAPEGTRLRVLTFNRGLGRLKTRELIEFIERERIDLICFQEGGSNPAPELEAYLANGWHRDSKGFLATRLPIIAELDSEELPWDEWGLWPVRLYRVQVRTESGQDFLLAGVHMPTMRFAYEKLTEGDTPGFYRYIDWRWEQMRRLVERLGESSDLPVLIGGDFNMPSDSPMMTWLRPRFAFAYEDAGWGYGFTRPTRHPWVRIDHLLASPEWAFTRCRVGPDLGSDHLPLIAEVVLHRP
jgi:endonuclease/exonuclease/phosphatase (EEP) superfamily protein YafD